MRLLIAILVAITTSCAKLPDDLVESESTSIVGMKENKFIPEVIKIKKGTKIIWINMDTTHHNVNLKFVISPYIGSRSTWRYTFDKEGTYNYWCDPHRYMGMKGTVIVE